MREKSAKARELLLAGVAPGTRELRGLEELMPGGASLHFSPRSTCLLGLMTLGVLGFIGGVADDARPSVLHLERAAELAVLLGGPGCAERACPPADCAGAATRWPFTPAEVIRNYARVTWQLWHTHELAPAFRWDADAAYALPCPLPRGPEPWERGPRAPARPGAISVFCAVLVVWPAEVSRMELIAQTYGPRCAPLVFFVAADAPTTFRGYTVINLRASFPHVPEDGGEESNTIYKALHAFLYAPIHVRTVGIDVPDVTCRLDADTIFEPRNFARVASCRGLDFDEVWAVGHASYLHKFAAPGAAFFLGGAGICLSRGALMRFDARTRGGQMGHARYTQAWRADGCQAAPGHWDDVMLGNCFRSFGIPLSRAGVDCRGRDLFYPGPDPGENTPVRGVWRAAAVLAPEFLSKKALTLS